MRPFNCKNQSGQAVIEYVFVLVFMMVIVVTFVREYSSAIGRSVQTLNYTLTHFSTAGACPNTCLMKMSEFENALGN